MRPTLTLLTALCLSLGLTAADRNTSGQVGTDLLAVMADTAGDLTYATPEWVTVAQEALDEIAVYHVDNLKGIEAYSVCEVAHNPPAYLHRGAKLAWNLKWNGFKFTAAVGELSSEECDLKIQADHSVLSNIAHIEYHGNDPAVVASAMARLRKLTRWEIDGRFPENEVLKSVFRALHDAMAPRTMPRFVWMSPEWVSSARHIVSDRAKEFAEGIKDVSYTFCEVFTDPPAFAFPDGEDSGFWVHCSYGEVTVGYGMLPEELGKPDYLNKMLFTPVIPLGRTVNAAMTEDDKASQKAYSAAAFSVKLGDDETPISQSDRSKNKPMPKGLQIVMRVLHDELSKRSSGELPSDYDASIRPEWAKPYAFDRHPDHDITWLRYDEFDIYGNPR